VGGEAVEAARTRRRQMKCISCLQEIGLGKRVFVIPFEEYAPDACLVAHPECMPNLEGKENVLDGFYVEGSKPVFIPRQLVEALKGEEKSQGG
jgi:hypothetical protein